MMLRRRHDAGMSSYQHASGYFTGNSIIIDKRRSGYPCRAEITCRFISAQAPARDKHEFDVHSLTYEIPTSPNATAGFASVVAFRARTRRAAH